MEVSVGEGRDNTSGQLAADNPLFKSSSLLAAILAFMFNSIWK